VARITGATSVPRRKGSLFVANVNDAGGPPEHVPIAHRTGSAAGASYRFPSRFSWALARSTRAAALPGS